MKIILICLLFSTLALANEVNDNNLKVFKTGCKRNLEDHCFKLGLYFSNQKNSQIAKEYFYLACEQKHAIGCYNYAEYVLDTNADIQVAKKYFNLACEYGEADGCDNYKQLSKQYKDKLIKEDFTKDCNAAVDCILVYDVDPCGAITSISRSNNLKKWKIFLEKELHQYDSDKFNCSYVELDMQNSISKCLQKKCAVVQANQKKSPKGAACMNGSVLLKNRCEDGLRCIDVKTNDIARTWSSGVCKMVPYQQ